MIATETIFVRPSSDQEKKPGTVFMQVKSLSGWAAVSMSYDEVGELINALDLAANKPSCIAEGYTINQR